MDYIHEYNNMICQIIPVINEFCKKVERLHPSCISSGVLFLYEDMLGIQQYLLRKGRMMDMGIDTEEIHSPDVTRPSYIIPSIEEESLSFRANLLRTRVIQGKIEEHNMFASRGTHKGVANQEDVAFVCDDGQNTPDKKRCNYWVFDDKGEKNIRKCRNSAEHGKYCDIHNRIYRRKNNISTSRPGLDYSGSMESSD